MKAILLSAGQGRRLLPLTQSLPKCLLPVDGTRSMLEFQLRTLARCGFRDAVVLVGFGSERVERFAAESRLGIQVRTRFNPLYRTTDNLITTWLALAEMDGDFALLNGDTLFEPALLERLLARATGPVHIAVDHKAAYDDDDMKVCLDSNGRLQAIGKKLEATPNGEAIGLSVFRGSGVASFRDALDAAVRHPEALRAWYPSVLHGLAAETPVQAESIDGLWWREVDDAKDLGRVRQEIAARRSAAPAAKAVGARPI